MFEIFAAIILKLSETINLLLFNFPIYL